MALVPQDTALAQGGVVTGRVIDAEIAEPISGTTVEVITGSGRVISSTTVHANGEFRLTAVRPGRYSLLFSVLSYETRRLDGVRVAEGPGLARNSDIFKAGVDMAGVHLYGGLDQPDSTLYQSSAISAIDTWTSPVLLIHGDDDRNVDFSQTVGLVQLLRAHEVPYELIVFPDDVHDSLLFHRWLEAFNATDDFFDRHLLGSQ